MICKSLFILYPICIKGAPQPYLLWLLFATLIWQLHSWGQFMKIRDASETSSSHGGMYAPGVISVPQLSRLKDKVSNFILVCWESLNHLFVGFDKQQPGLLLGQSLSHGFMNQDFSSKLWWSQELNTSSKLNLKVFILSKCTKNGWHRLMTKKVRPKEFYKGNLVLKEILPMQKDAELGRAICCEEGFL